ncbi:hypothetical protein GCM10009809_08490 [Isoptericola hypogeus]|uniref:Aromatic ring-opening dioxygenase LigA n=1 Tax=Isoptericola hypogeus TaxID=300179 RepID=A0ABP4UZ27_9MICO
MSSTVTVRPAKGVRGIGLFSIIAGIVLIVAGVVVWIVVSMTLSAEEITVSDDSTFMNGMFAGDHVSGPLTAYAQADVIDMHATEMAGGQTYAELPQDDPIRDSVMDASFLRASLFTSVVAFGVCALVIGLGILFLFIGGALRRLAGGPQVAVETPGYSSQGDLSTAPRHADPEPAAPPAQPAPPSRPTTRQGPDTTTTESGPARSSGTAPSSTPPPEPPASTTPPSA